MTHGVTFITLYKTHQRESWFCMDENQKYIDDLSERLRNHTAAAMIGAGFDRNADPIDESVSVKFPMWLDLGKAFGKKLGLSEKESEHADSIELAQKVEKDFRRPALEALIEELIPDEDYKPSNVFIDLLRLPWKDIFTTNYDTLLERTRPYVKEREYNVVINEDKLPLSAGKPRIILLHGAINKEPLIITEEDYRTFPNMHSVFTSTIRQSLIENVFCLLGFSGDDPNFRKWSGWIRDNLKERSLTIYLVLYERGTGDQYILGENIKPIYLNEVYHCDDYRKCIEAFLKELNEKCNPSNSDETSENVWPKKELSGLTFDSKITLKDLRRLLQENRVSYPGWIVIPNSDRKNIQYILDRVSDRIINTKAYSHNIFDICYEFAWLSNKNCEPLSGNMCKKLTQILDKAPKGIRSEKEAQYIMLTILRTYRMIGDQEAWERLYLHLTFLQLKPDCDNYFKFECISHSIDSLKFKEAERQIKLWEVQAVDTEWALRKASLLTVFGMTKEATDLLLESLKDCREHICSTGKAGTKASSNELNQGIDTSVSMKSSENQSALRYLSYESCLINLYNFIQSTRDSRSMKEREEETKVPQFAYSRLDLWDEKQKRIDEIKSIYKNPGLVSRTPSFEPGRQNITFRFGDGSFYEARRAFSYLMFREETGQPFRIGYVSDAEGVDGVISRIFDYNKELAIAISILSDYTNLCKVYFTRAYLSELSLEDVRDYFSRFIELLGYALEDIKDNGRIEGLKAYILEVVVELLGRLCSRCNHEELVDVYGILKLLYKTIYSHLYISVQSLTCNAIYADHPRFLRDDIKLFATFTMVGLDGIELNNYPDPFIYIIDQQKRIKQDKDIKVIIDGLLAEAETSQFPKNHIVRLTALYKCFEFSDSQKTKLKELLWSNVDAYGLPDTGFILKACAGVFPYDISDRKLEQSISSYLVAGINNETGDIQYRMNFYENCLNEVAYFLKNAKDLEAVSCLLHPLVELGNKLWDYYSKRKAYMMPDCISYIQRICTYIGKIHLRQLADLKQAVHAGNQEKSTLSEQSDEGQTNPKSPAISERSCLGEEEKDLISKLGNSHISHQLLSYLEGKDAFWEDLEDAMLLDSEYDLSDTLNTFQTLLDFRGAFEELKNINYRKYIDIMVSRLIMGTVKDASHLLNTLMGLVKNKEISDQFIPADNLDKSMHVLIEKTRFKKDDSDDVINQKLLVRVETARLAYEMKEYRQLDFASIREWEDICHSENEFNDVRTQWAS